MARGEVKFKLDIEALEKLQMTRLECCSFDCERNLFNCKDGSESGCSLKEVSIYNGKCEQFINIKGES